MKYSPERREAVLRKLLPPHSRTIADVAWKEGISTATLYIWRKEARRRGRLMPDADLTPEGRTSKDKFAAVLETGSLNEAKLAEYCRKWGLYPEQIRGWRAACQLSSDRRRGIKSYIKQYPVRNPEIDIRQPSSLTHKKCALTTNNIMAIGLRSC